MTISFNFTPPAAALAVGLGFLALGSAPALATPACGYMDTCIAPSGGAGDQTKAFVGLRWDFGSQSPSIVGGVRYTNTSEDETVYGAQLDAAFKLGSADNHAPTIRLLGLAGNTTILGELGVGLDLTTMQALIAGAVQLPYVAVGANYLIGGELAPYVEVNLLSKPGGSGALSCPDNYQLVGVTNGEMDDSNIPVDDSMITGGHTCFREPV